RHRFETSPFRMRLERTEFYQDPEDPDLKRGVYTLAFSHPVDVASLESRLSLQMHDGADRKVETPGQSVRYDERNLTAWVQSGPLQIPENGGRLQLSVRAGVASSLPGDSSADATAGEVALPSLYSVAIDSLQANVVENERHEPEQVLMLGFNQGLHDQEVTDAVHA